jgi:hypothetical protein
LFLKGFDMRRAYVSAAVATVLALAASLSLASLARADDAATTAPATTGSIKGTVVQPDGTEFDGTAVVTVTLPPPKGKAAKANGAGPHTRQKPVVPAITIKPDDKGAFTIENIPVGSYVVQVRDQVDKSTGREPANVVDSTPVTITVTLKAPKPKPSRGPTTTPAAPGN